MKCNWKASSSSSSSSRCDSASDKACARFFHLSSRCWARAWSWSESLGTQMQSQMFDCLPVAAALGCGRHNQSVKDLRVPARLSNSCIVLQAKEQAKLTTVSRPSSASGLQEAAQQSQAAAVKLTYSVAERAVAAGISKLLDLCCSLP